MKKLLLILITLLIPVVANSATWCKWDGAQGIDCQSDANGVRLDNGYRIVGEWTLNQFGYYLLDTTYPALGENQTRDTVQWSFDGSTISRTWTVRNLTAVEINEVTAAPMDIGQYYLWKALLVKGVITQQEAANTLPQELIEAYQAREALNQ